MGECVPKPKLLLFCQEPPRCYCYHKILHRAFDCRPTNTTAVFLNHMRSLQWDAAVVCFCSSRLHDNDLTAFNLNAFGSPIPLLFCRENLALDFIQPAIGQGKDRVIIPGMPAEEIRETLLGAISRSALREFLTLWQPGWLAVSPHVRHMLDTVIQTFPGKINEKELCRQLGISPRWLQKVCDKVFGVTFRHLMRRLRVYQALLMMQGTTLDNTEIAIYLNYSEASSMARDFRKELGYGPQIARRRLFETKPKDLLLR